MKLHILGTSVDVTENDIPVRRLKLDPENPRLEHIRRERGGRLDQATIEGELDGDARKLIDSVRATGGVSSPLIVEPQGRSFITREGNIRLICLKRLGAQARNGALPNVPANQFDKAPCILFPSGISRDVIDAYLASEHVGGRVRWDPLDQALHIYGMHKRGRRKIPEIASIVRRREETVKRMIKAVDLTWQYAQWVSGGDPQYVRRYSYFFELMKLLGKKEVKDNPQIEAIIQNCIRRKERKEELFGWIRDAKLYRAEHMRYLPQILGDRKAQRIMVDEDSRRAIYYITYERGTGLLAAIQTLRDRLRRSRITPEVRRKLESLQRHVERKLRSRT